jgi:hypothetical protein
VCKVTPKWAASHASLPVAPSNASSAALSLLAASAHGCRDSPANVQTGVKVTRKSVEVSRRRGVRYGYPVLCGGKSQSRGKECRRDKPKPSTLNPKSQSRTNVVETRRAKVLSCEGWSVGVGIGRTSTWRCHEEGLYFFQGQGHHSLGLRASSITWRHHSISPFF